MNDLSRSRGRDGERDKGGDERHHIDHDRVKRQSHEDEDDNRHRYSSSRDDRRHRDRKDHKEGRKIKDRTDDGYAQGRKIEDGYRDGERSLAHQGKDKDRDFRTHRDSAERAKRSYETRDGGDENYTQGRKIEDGYRDGERSLAHQGKDKDRDFRTHRDSAERAKRSYEARDGGDESYTQGRKIEDGYRDGERFLAHQGKDKDRDRRSHRDSAERVKRSYEARDGGDENYTQGRKIEDGYRDGERSSAQQGKDKDRDLRSHRDSAERAKRSYEARDGGDRDRDSRPHKRREREDGDGRKEKRHRVASAEDDGDDAKARDRGEKRKFEENDSKTKDDNDEYRKEKKHASGREGRGEEHNEDAKQRIVGPDNGSASASFNVSILYHIRFLNTLL